MSVTLSPYRESVRSEGVLCERAGEYWDANREKARDPAFWMAHPLCREAINRRVTGSPREWPLDWLRRVHVSQPFERGVTWGCGGGAFERSAIRTDLVRSIDAFDISRKSLEDAQNGAEAEDLSRCVHYRVGNFDDPIVPRYRYDVAFFHAALHHVFQLERLFRRLALGLKPGGALYLDEYVGPSRHEWRPRDLDLAQAVLDMAPREAKVQEKLLPPIEPDDPTEAIRASEIAFFVREYFDVVAWKPYGGQIADLVFPCLAPAWTATPEGRRFVSALLTIEDREMDRDPSSTHHLVAFGRLKRADRPVRFFARQARLAWESRALRRRTRDSGSRTSALPRTR
jgi:SAM-dependent methyltransferase